MEKLLIANGSELLRIEGGVGKARFFSESEGASLKYKYLSRVVSSTVNLVER